LGLTDKHRLSPLTGRGEFGLWIERASHDLIQIKATKLAARDTCSMLAHPLARDVFVVIAVKLVVVIAVAMFVFGPTQRPHMDAGAVESRLIGVPIGPAAGDTSP
jgi:hypothetical protein